MNDTKHTPEPWHLWSEGGINSDCYSIPGVATLRADNPADAELMGAAAKMHQALRLCLEAHGRTVEQANDDVPLEEWEEVARRAMAKATGTE